MAGFFQGVSCWWTRNPDYVLRPGMKWPLRWGNQKEVSADVAKPHGPHQTQREHGQAWHRLPQCVPPCRHLRLGFLGIHMQISAVELGYRFPGLET